MSSSPARGATVSIPKVPGWVNNSPKRRQFWGVTENFSTYKQPDGSLVRIEKRSEDPTLEIPRPVTDSPQRFNTTYGGTWASPSRKKRDFVPRFEALAKKVLSWSGFFREAIEDSPVESERLRKVKFVYYLEDDTCEMMEPKETNSGLPQGGFLKRHQISLPDGTNLTWDKLRIGETIEIYGKVIMITECDKYTRDYCEEKGKPQIANQSMPTGVQSNWKEFVPEWLQDKVQDRDFKIYCEALLGRTWHDSAAMARFIHFNGLTLKFKCCWDDRDSMYGDINDYTIIYYLEDDSVQIVEIRPPNSGRFVFNTLFKRGTLIKNWKAQYFAGGKEHYTITDFKIGNKINVFGRDLVICGLSADTRKWFSENADKVGFDQPLDNYRKEPVKVWPKNVPPEWNGYGTEEDSLNSCHSLQMKPPRKDLDKWRRFEGQLLRFSSLMESDVSENNDRRLVIVFYLEDDSLRIFEPMVHNSGFAGGTFLSRKRYKSSATNEYITADDLKPGALLEINKFKLRLQDSDKQTTELLKKREELGYWPQNKQAKK